MIHASATWKQQFQFEGKGNGGIPVAMDGDGKTGNSPTDLVLIALCGCTAYDVVSILQKKNTARCLPCSAKPPGSPMKSSWTRNERDSECYRVQPIEAARCVSRLYLHWFGGGVMGHICQPGTC